MTGTEEPTQPVIATQVRRANLGTELWRAAQVSAQPDDYQELVIDRPALAGNVSRL